MVLVHDQTGTLVLHRIPHQRCASSAVAAVTVVGCVASVTPLLFVFLHIPPQASPVNLLVEAVPCYFLVYPDQTNALIHHDGSIPLATAKPTSLPSMSHCRSPQSAPPLPHCWWPSSSPRPGQISAAAPPLAVASASQTHGTTTKLLPHYKFAPTYNNRNNTSIIKLNTLGS